MADRIPSKKKRKTAAPKRMPVKKKRRKRAAVRSSMPAWLRGVIGLCIVAVFSVCFYFLAIRPFAYRWKPCYGREEYGVCIPYGYDVHGIDISHHQGEIDWSKLQTAQDNRFPLSFVFMKATEGSDYGDDCFADNFEAARRHGFIRGAYHFFSPKTDPALQADFFIRTVKLQPGDLPPVLDIEVSGKKKKEEIQHMAMVWLKKVEQHYGVRPVLYTSYKFKLDYLNTDSLNRYPYWIAHYYVDSVAYQGKWHFWQHTDVGTVPGIRNRVDLNIFNGTLEELKALCLRK